MDSNINNYSGTTIGYWDLDMTMGLPNRHHQQQEQQEQQEQIDLLDSFNMELFSQQQNLPQPNLISIGQEQEGGGEEEDGEERLGAMKEMMYKIAAMQPVEIDPSTIKKPKRRNVRISDDPQSVAARHRRERISERIRILQRLVPGGTKMDTASMLDEAIRYVKFLKRQVRELQTSQHLQPSPAVVPLPPPSAIATQLVSSGVGSSSLPAGAGHGIGFVFSGDGSCSQHLNLDRY